LRVEHKNTTRHHDNRMSLLKVCVQSEVGYTADLRRGEQGKL
jgi:hypothetical protein